MPVYSFSVAEIYRTFIFIGDGATMCHLSSFHTTCGESLDRTTNATQCLNFNFCKR